MLKTGFKIELPLAALLLLTLFLGVNSRANADIQLRLSQNLSPISGVTIVAKEKGFFSQLGLNVSVSDFTSGKLCLQAVMGGAAEIATNAEAPTAAAMAKEPIAFLARTEYSNLKTLTAASANIKSLNAMNGLTSTITKRLATGLFKPDTVVSTLDYRTPRGHICASNVELSFTTNRQQNIVASNINLDIKSGEFICLLGPSGCGKSSFGHSVKHNGQTMPLNSSRGSQL